MVNIFSFLFWQEQSGVKIKTHCREYEQVHRSGKKKKQIIYIYIYI